MMEKDTQAGAFHRHPMQGVETEQPPAIEEALSVVNNRRAVYGSPKENITHTARLWSAYLGFEVTPEQVAGCMILVKLSRLKKTPTHRDSIVDIIGYADVYDQVK